LVRRGDARCPPLQPYVALCMRARGGGGAGCLHSPLLWCTRLARLRTDQPRPHHLLEPLGCASPQAASLVADCVLKGMMHTDSCNKLEDQVKFPPFQATELQARTAAWE
jgi:hypothetical protein